MLWQDPDHEIPVWSAIIELVKPELKRLMEILEASTKAANDAIENEIMSELVSVHKKIQTYLTEARKLKSDMAKKNRTLGECDDIMRTLENNANRISRTMIDMPNGDSEEEGLF